MRKFLSTDAQQVIQEKVRLMPSLEKVSGIDEKCDAVRSISTPEGAFDIKGGAIIYDNGHGTLKSAEIDKEIIYNFLPNLDNFRNLVSVSIRYPSHGKFYMHKWPQSLKSIELGGDRDNWPAPNLAPLGELPNLRSLVHYMRDVRLTELFPLADKLKILGFGNAIDMENIAQFKDLQTLNYGRHTGSMEPVGALEKLHTLCIESVKERTLDGLESCKGLERIRIQGGSLADIDALAELDNLRVVEIPCSRIENIAALEGSKIEILHLHETAVLDFSPLAEMTELRELTLSNTYFKDMELLAGLKKLERLWICNTWVDDLTPLSGLENLEYLDMQECREIRDLSPLYGLKKLKEVKLGYERFAKFEKDTTIPEKFREILTRL